MTSLKFTVVPHLLLSPDLEPSDFWLFPNMKETLEGQNLLLDADVEQLCAHVLAANQKLSS
jgi:hypothetical protein